MRNILIFGGTTEGRLLAEFCDRERIHSYVSVVSEYGKELLAESPYLHINVSPMDACGMEQFIVSHKIGLVVDATHPYALLVTVHIKKACEAAGVRRLRCGREFEKAADVLQRQGARTPEQKTQSVKTGNIIYVSSAADAAEYLKCRQGNVFITTGSKELSAFTVLENFKERCFARVLPSPEVLSSCEKTGLSMSHLICMQGPFSEEMNKAMLRQTEAVYLVTKETGAAGGFEDKLRAAGDCGVTAIVIKRRDESDSLSFDKVCRIIKEFSSINSGSLENGAEISVILAGTGPGGAGQVTEEVVKAVRASEVLIGAPRVLETARELLRGENPGGVLGCSEGMFSGSHGQNVRFVEKYMPEDVAGELERCRLERVKGAVVLFSGDTGFYSGTKKLMKCLKERNISFHVLPGISSVSYMASRLQTSWEDAALFTAHGRDFDPIPVIEGGQERLFVLLGGENGAGRLCKALCSSGYGHLMVSVGEDLSYPQEKILTGTAEALKDAVFGSLCLMLIEKGDENEG